MSISDAVEYCNVTYRLIPGRRAKAAQLARIVGACRYVWNTLLDDQEQIHTIARMCGAKTPAPTFFTLGKGFTQLRRSTPWLGALPFTIVRYTCKQQADAWQAFFRGDSRRPRFHGRHGRAGFMIPQDVRIADGQLTIPKVGRLRLQRRGGNPYPDGVPKQAAVNRIAGKWYAVVCYAVPVADRPDDGTVTGIDMNAGQVADSNGTIHRMPDTRRLEAKAKRLSRELARRQRGSRRRDQTRRRLAKACRKIAMIRRNWQHQVSHELAGGTVAVEQLRPAAMTRSARGTAMAPGTNVRQKAGLNRVILATGWGQLRQMLEYKAPHVVAVEPAYSSQTCAICGHADPRSRPAQAVFHCVACGHADHADLNAARNIRRWGMALLHGEGRSVQPTPATRERDRALMAQAVQSTI